MYKPKTYLLTIFSDKPYSDLKIHRMLMNLTPGNGMPVIKSLGDNFFKITAYAEADKIKSALVFEKGIKYSLSNFKGSMHEKKERKNPLPRDEEKALIKSSVKLFPGHKYTADIKGRGVDVPVRDITKGTDRYEGDYIVEHESRFVRSYPVENVSYIRKVDETHKNPFIKKGPVSRINFSESDTIFNKKQYLKYTARYLSTNNEAIGRQAAMYQSFLQRSLSPEQYRSFIKQAIPCFKRGKVESKSLLTLLNSLDKQVSNGYTSIVRKNPGNMAGNLKKISENRAAKLFETFHHFPADKIKEVTINAGKGKIKIDCMQIGTMPSLIYRSNKDINDDGSRKFYTYSHSNKKHLDLYVDADKKMFIIPLDGQDIIGRGLIYKKGKKVQK